MYIGAMTKTEKQEQGIRIWNNAIGKGTLNYIMRFGKTKIIDMVVSRILNKRESAKIIIVVPNDITYKNIIENVNGVYEVYTIHQLINKYKANENIECDLFIIDEIHKMLSGFSLESLFKVKRKFTLGLTGSTITKEQSKLLDQLDAPIIDTITEGEAIANGWISDSIEYNVAVELTDSEKETYSKYSTIISDVLGSFNSVHNFVNTRLKAKVFDSPFDICRSCFTGKLYKDYKKGTQFFIKPNVLRDIVANSMGWKKDVVSDNKYDNIRDEYWNPNNIYERTKLFVNIVRKRNELLILNRNKVNTVLEILKKYPKPTICFNESIEMVDILFNNHPNRSVAYHSKIESQLVHNFDTGDIFRFKDGRPKKLGKVSLKKYAIKEFKRNNLNTLFTANSLNEGLNIENLEQVILTGGTINPQVYEQRIARGKTIDPNNPTKQTIIWNLYIEDFYIGETLVKSRDKEKLKIRQDKSHNTPIWISDLNNVNI